MIEQSPLDTYIRAVRERQDKAVRALQGLIYEFPDASSDDRKALANQVIASLTALRAMFAESDAPQTILLLLRELEWFLNGAKQAGHLLDAVVPLRTQLERQTWDLSNEKDMAYDFDAVFNRYRSQSKLPELLDRIIQLMEQLHKSGEIDSLTLLRAIERVIATLKQGRNGSYFSFHGAWSFMISFLKNYIWAELAKLPGLGTAMEALEKTILEANEEMQHLQESVKNEIVTSLTADLKSLPKGAAVELDFISYTKTGNLHPGLPAPTKFQGVA